MVFQILIAFILALFAGVFLVIYLFDRRHKSAGWFSVSYCTGLAAFSFHISTDSSFLPTILLTKTLFWASCGALAAAGCARVQRPFPLRSFAAAMLLGYISSLYFTIIRQDDAMLLFATNVVSGLIVLMSVPALFSARQRQIDRAVFYCFLAIAAIFILRPLASLGILTAIYDTNDYVKTFYPLVQYMSTGIIALGAAAVAMIASGLDIAEQLQRESDTDHLTGLHNQRGFANMLDKDVDNNGKYGFTGHAILMFDIDHFKNINDEFGHEQGDRVLAKIGRTITQLMKYHGVAARSGGEEFVFLFSRESSQAAFLVSEHLRVAIGMLQYTGLPEGQRITISLGLAFVREGEPVKRAMRRADTALYRAKDDGRNCLRLAEGDNLPEAEYGRSFTHASPHT